MRVAFIGAGYMARCHAEAISEETSSNLVGVCSNTISSANTFADDFSINVRTTNVSDLMTLTTPDIVIVAVPELELKNVCSELFKFKSVILLEKPAGYTFDDAYEIHRLAKSSFSNIFVSFNRRFYASTLQLCNEVSLTDGFRFIQVFDQESPLKALESGQPRLVCENWMYANSIHLVDLIRILGRGDVKSVTSNIHVLSKDSKVVYSDIHFSSGDFARYTGLWNLPGPWSIDVTTQERRWELRPIEKLRYQLPDQRTPTETDSDPEDLSFKPGLRKVARELTRYFDGNSTKLPTLDDSLKSMELVKRIYENW